MSRVVISAKDLPDELRRREAAIRQAIVRGIRSGARRGRATLVRKTPKDQGLMKAAWRDTATGAGGGEVAEVLNDAPYAGVVEMGARPHAVSEEGKLAIFEWAKRHFGFLRVGRRRGQYMATAFDTQNAGKVRRKIGGVLGQFYMDTELVRLVEAIVHKIETKGQAPTYFIRGSLEQLSREALQEVDRELQAVAKQGKAS